MPSIRRSLIAYFLLLLGLAVAGVAVLYDRLASEAVQERKAAELQLVQQKLDSRNQDASEKFNNELYLHAKSLAREIRQKYNLLVNRPPDPEAQRRFRLVLGVHPLGFGLNPWSSVVSIAATNNTSVRFSLTWVALAPPSLEEIVRQSMESDDHTGLFQVHVGRQRQAIRPVGQTLNLPLDVAQLDRQVPWSEEYSRTDEVEVVGDGIYRRVIYRPPLWTFRSLRPPGPVRDGTPGKDGPREAAPMPRTPSGNAPAAAVQPPRPPTPIEWQSVYVQYARKKSDLEAIYATHKKTAEEEEARVIAATQARLSWLRTWLVVIGLSAFTAMVLGGWLLIGRGLAPLAHLSEAVSKVSPTDFRLPVERSELSEELLPIHDRLTHTLEALKRAFEREKQAVADISHELRTPLAALQTTIEVCLRKPREPEKYREVLADCRDIGQQLNKLVNRILTLANLDAGNVRPEKTLLGVDDLVREVSALIRPLAESQEIEFHTSSPAHLHFESDPDKLREVLMNLLHNGIEYNRPGGRLDLVITWDQARDLVRLEVSDTGIGMTPEIRAKIFERFFRADPSRTATGVHAGLGLAIVQEYVTRLGGTVEVDSTPDVGSTFRLLFPHVNARMIVPEDQPLPQLA